ncbi:hypothetical protein KGP36_02875 [Patescibacteria group bacterium]|nr:hypothetical protein [Patescibacteria group bacterium]
MADHEQGKLWNALLQRFALPLATFCIGFGSSEMMAVQSLHDRVMSNDREIRAVAQDVSREQDTRVSEDREIREQIYSTRAQTEKRMEYVVTLMEGLMKQNSEVIGLFKLQQQFDKK